MEKPGGDQMHPEKWVNAAEDCNGLFLLANLAETLSDNIMSNNQCHEGQSGGKKIPLELLQGRLVETAGNTSHKEKKFRLTDIKRLARSKKEEPKKKTRGSHRKGYGGKHSKGA